MSDCVARWSSNRPGMVHHPYSFGIHLNSMPLSIYNLFILASWCNLTSISTIIMKILNENSLCIGFCIVSAVVYRNQLGPISWYYHCSFTQPVEPSKLDWAMDWVNLWCCPQHLKEKTTQSPIQFLWLAIFSHFKLNILPNWRTGIFCLHVEALKSPPKYRCTLPPLPLQHCSIFSSVVVVVQCCGKILHIMAYIVISRLVDQQICKNSKSEIAMNIDEIHFSFFFFYIRATLFRNWHLVQFGAPPHWSYIVHKQVIGGRSGWDRDTTHTITRQWTIKAVILRGTSYIMWL